MSWVHFQVYFICRLLAVFASSKGVEGSRGFLTGQLDNLLGGDNYKTTVNSGQKFQDLFWNKRSTFDRAQNHGGSRDGPSTTTPSTTTTTSKITDKDDDKSTSGLRLASAVDSCYSKFAQPKQDALGRCIIQLVDDFGPISEWNTSHIYEMSLMFQQCRTFNADISKWNVSRVTSMGFTFEFATKFNADLSKWDVSSVNNMNSLFKSATVFNSDISKWDVSSVTAMTGMFWGAKAFNRDISKWNVGRVKTMDHMFAGAKNFSQKLCGAMWVAAKTNTRILKTQMFTRSHGSLSRTVCDECVDRVKGTCLEPRHVGDSICDDRNNNAGCGWDGGDCCGTKNYDYCTKCECLDCSKNKIANKTGGKKIASSTTDMPTTSHTTNGVHRRTTTTSTTTTNPLSRSSTWLQRRKPTTYTSYIPTNTTTTILSTTTTTSTTISTPTTTTITTTSATTTITTTSATTTITTTSATTTITTTSATTTNISTPATTTIITTTLSTTKATTLPIITTILVPTKLKTTVAITTSTSTALVFSSRMQLNYAVLECLQISMKGDCPASEYGSMDTWDVSGMTSMVGVFDMFETADTFSEFNADVSKWDVSRVTSMDSMFFAASSFNGDISKWNVSRTTDMRSMFDRAIGFKGDLSKWDVSRVTYMTCMFDQAEAFNGDISTWNVSSASMMDNMFRRAVRFNASISAWDVSNVKSMSSMFEGATFFNADISNWDVSQVVIMTKMFDSASNFNADISKWNVSRVEFMHSMFQRATVFNIDISKWDVSSVVDMDAMFKRAYSFNRRLCGRHWIHSLARRNEMFHDSPGSICFSTTTAVVIEPVTTIETIITDKGIIDYYFPSKTDTPQSNSLSFVVVVVVCVVVFTLLVWAVTVFAMRKMRGNSPSDDAESVSHGDSFSMDLAAPSMPLIPIKENDPESQSEDVAETTIVPLSERTFADSNFKRYYDSTDAPLFQHYLLSAVNNMLKLYANRLNPFKSRSTLATYVNEFMKKIQNDAFKAHKDMGEDVGIIAEYLWTSGKVHRVVNNMELCSVLNAVIRDDIEEEVKAAVVFFRSINSRRPKRVAGCHAVDTSYPPNGETWRGGGFRLRYRPFYDSMVGKKYRVPGFLATSSKRSVAANFAFDLHGANFCVIWKIMFDKRGKKHPEYRVQHMTFVSNTLIKGENEYLFAPYSVFTVVSIKWSTKVRTPHELVIQAAVDNRAEDETLPLAPWY